MSLKAGAATAADIAAKFGRVGIAFDCVLAKSFELQEVTLEDLSSVDGVLNILWFD